MCMTGNIIYHQHGFVWKCGTLRSNGLSTCITILHIEFAVLGAYPIFRHAHIRIKLPPLCTVLVSRIAHCHIRLSRMGFPHGETKLKTALPNTFTAAHETRSLREDQAKQFNAWNRWKIPLSGAAPSSLSWFSSNTTTILTIPAIHSPGPMGRQVGTPKRIGKSLGHFSAPGVVADKASQVTSMTILLLRAMSDWCLVSLSICV